MSTSVDYVIRHDRGSAGTANAALIEWLRRVLTHYLTGQAP